MSRTDFLDNVRVARNLLVHGEADAGAHSGGAIWITPSAVRGFRADDFPELDPARRQALADAVRDFERVAKQVSPGAAATQPQLREARAAFEKMLTVVGDYLPTPQEAVQVEAALRATDFPPWVVNWQCEIGNDHEGCPAVWVTLYADERALPAEGLARRVIDLVPKLRAALTAAHVQRWPYVRVWGVREYMAGQGSRLDGAA